MPVLEAILPRGSARTCMHAQLCRPKPLPARACACSLATPQVTASVSVYACAPSRPDISRAASRHQAFAQAPSYVWPLRPYVWPLRPYVWPLETLCVALETLRVALETLCMALETLCVAP